MVEEKPQEETKRDMGGRLSFSFSICLTAIFAALLAAVKFALVWLPNVEAVSFLIILFTAVFGFRVGFFSALIFALTDGIFYGYGYYTVSYIIQYPGIALVTAIVSLRGIKSEYVYTAVALIMSVFFGIHTAILDSLAFGYPFLPRYLSGILFYVATILSSTLLTLFAFNPLAKLLQRLKLGWNK